MDFYGDAMRKVKYLKILVKIMASFESVQAFPPRYFVAAVEGNRNIFFKTIIPFLMAIGATFTKILLFDLHTNKTFICIL